MTMAVQNKNTATRGKEQRVQAGGIGGDGRKGG